MMKFAMAAERAKVIMGATCWFARGGRAHTLEFFATGLSLSAAPLAANTKKHQYRVPISAICAMAQELIDPEIAEARTRLPTLVRRLSPPSRLSVRMFGSGGKKLTSYCCAAGW